MTIECSGYVEKMERGQANKIRLYIVLEMIHSGGTVVVEASEEELGGLYLPGTSVRFTIIPSSGTKP